METSLISIIVPVYNVGRYLTKCLDSILMQTVTDWECVLVDDGSTDESGHICDEYAAADSRFVVVHKKNEGVALARLTGFEHSKGEYITFIDADDYVSPEYLEKLVKPILEKDADMVSCDYLIVESNESIREPRAKLNGEFEKEQIKDFIEKHYFYDKETKGYGMTCFLCTKMVKRIFVEDGLKNGLGLWFGEDQISMFHMLIHCHRLSLISDRLYYYVRHDGQATRKYNHSLWESINQTLEEYRKLCESIGLNHCLGLRKRTWMYINTTIHKKMLPANLTKQEFICHLKKMRNNSYMNYFFMLYTIDYSVNGLIRYWLLKCRLYNIIYIMAHVIYYLKNRK